MTSKILKARKYWFAQQDLLKPIDWKYLKSLPRKVRLPLELYMEGRVSIGRASEMSGWSFREFDQYRANARIPLRGPSDE